VPTIQPSDDRRASEETQIAIKDGWMTTQRAVTPAEQVSITLTQTGTDPGRTTAANAITVT
jgi:hypothetical protein